MKKIVIVFLIFSFIHALSLKDMIYSNSSSSGKFNTNGQMYFFGGNYELRFKKNTYAFKPWINGEAPRFHIGCNGISISGGFISLLGLKDIKDQLDNASVAFAWGLMMGIKASLPIVAEVFETLQKWARVIQKLLQNACAMGQVLAKQNYGSLDLTNSLMEKLGGDGYNEVKTALDNFGKKAAGFSEMVDSFINGSDKSKANILGAKIIKSNIKGSFVSMATFYFAKYLPELDKKSFIVSDLKKLYNGYIGDKHLSISDNNEFERKVLFHKLTLLAFGEIGISKKSYEDYISKIFDNNGNINTDKLKEAGKKTLSGLVDKSKVNLIYIPASLDAKTIYDGLMYGFKDLNSSSTASCSGGKCKINNYKIIYLDAKTDEAVNSGEVKTSSNNSINKDKGIIKGFALIASSNGTTNFEWDGFYKKSFAAIRNEVYNQSNLESEYTFIREAPATNDKLSDLQIIFPGMQKYINILVLMAKKYKKETYYMYYLEKLLAKKNAQSAIFILVNDMDNYSKTLINDPNMNLNKASKAAITDYYNHIHNIKEDILTFLENEIKINNSWRKLDEMFDQINREIKQENLKNLGF